MASIPGGSISRAAGERLAARLGSLNNRAKRSAGHKDADGDYDGDTGAHGGYGQAQKPWAPTRHTRGTHNAAPSKMTKFGENTHDEGHGRATGKLKPNHINDRDYQTGNRMSRGANVARPGGIRHNADHIDTPANKKLFPAGGKIGKRKGFGAGVKGGKVMPSPRRYLQGAPRSEYE